MVVVVVELLLEQSFSPTRCFKERGGVFEVFVHSEIAAMGGEVVDF